MRRRLRHLFTLFVLTSVGAFAADWALPPVDGALSGDVDPTLLPGAPRLHWDVAVQVSGRETRHLVFTASGPGTRVRVEADVDLRSGDGRWKLDEAVFDASRWMAPLDTKLGAGLAGAAATGQIQLTGNGALRAGVPAGTVAVAWHDATVKNPGTGWTIAGVNLDAEFAFDAGKGTVRGTRPGKLSIGTITTKRFGARNLVVDAQLKDLRTLAVAAARIEIAGGTVVASPATVALSPLNVSLELQISRVGLQDIAALVPGTVSEARGRLDGTVRLNWAGTAGFSLGKGHLVLSEGEPAQLRLAPSPGLISSSLPAKVLKYYPGLGQIETGQVPIRAELLDIAFTPSGDAEGRTASVHLVGGPVDPKLRAPIDLVVNVRGPLESLIRFGTSSKLHFGGK